MFKANSFRTYSCMWKCCIIFLINSSNQNQISVYLHSLASGQTLLNFIEFKFSVEIWCVRIRNNAIKTTNVISQLEKSRLSVCEYSSRHSEMFRSLVEIDLNIRSRIEGIWSVLTETSVRKQIFWNTYLPPLPLRKYQSYAQFFHSSIAS